MVIEANVRDIFSARSFLSCFRQKQLAGMTPIILDSLFGLALDGAAPFCLAPIVNLLAFSKRELTLDLIAFQVKPSRDKSQALFLRLGHQLVDFLLVQQQTAAGKGVVVQGAPGAMGAERPVDTVFRILPVPEIGQAGGNQAREET